MEPVFKRATTADLDTLLALMRQLYDHEQIAFDAAGARSALKLMLNHAAYGCAELIYVGETLVGYLVVAFCFSLEYGGCDAYLDELYLYEPYRGQGIGTLSLQQAEAICRERGIRALHLEVEYDNAKAQALYRKAGYAKRDRHLFTKRL